MKLLDSVDASTFKISFEQIADASGHDALAVLQRPSTLRIEGLHLVDLLPEDPRYEEGHGVYLFYSEGGEVLYVGKNSSQSFIERIPWHLAVGEGCWMNHFVKGIRKHYSGTQPDLANLNACAKFARSCSLRLVPFLPEHDGYISALETYLRIFLTPAFNRYKHDHSAGLNNDLPLRHVLASRWQIAR